MKKATKEQINHWKAIHKEIFEVTVEDAVCYLKKPDRATISAAMSVGQTDPMKYNEILMENCWVGGDEIVKTDNDYFFAAIEQMGALFEEKKATLKKL